MQRRSSKSVDELIDSMVSNRLANMYTFLMARVINFYPEKMRADVQPLITNKTIDGKVVENSITTNLPVLFPNSKDIYVRTPLVKGDLVLVGYNTIALDEMLLSDKPVITHSKRRFSQKDGIVLGGYRFDSGADTLVGEPESIVIHRRSTNTVIKITPGGDVILTGVAQCNVQCNTASVQAEGSTAVTASEVSIKANSVSIEASSTSISGDLSVGGKASIQGTMTGGKIQTSSGIDMDQHTHSYRPGDGSPTSTTAPE